MLHKMSFVEMSVRDGDVGWKSEDVRTAAAIYVRSSHVSKQGREGKKTVTEK